MKIDKQVKGTRILTGDEAKLRRFIINTLIDTGEQLGYEEILLPSIEPTEIYTDRVGSEIVSQMYTFEDKKGRNICLRPEGTATVQLIQEKLCGKKDVKFFYETKCWRYERPQAGRYREFTQFGYEWLNPSNPAQARSQLILTAKNILELLRVDYTINSSAKRGLSYYTEDGFEASAESLGAQKQVLGGGAYENGVGMAFGVDRLMLACPSENPDLT